MIDGKYAVLRDLGEGSYATVKLVQRLDGSLAAMKVFKDSHNWAKEYDIVKKLDSPWTIHVYDCNGEGKLTTAPHADAMAEQVDSCCRLKHRPLPYFVMELAGNGELCDFLQTTGCLSFSISRYYFRELVSALEYIHSNGISHRDIKLQNILISDDFKIKLADFGLAMSTETKDSDNLFSGTLSYVPPEAWNSGLRKEGINLGEKADIYSLGIVLFNLVSGYMPYAKASSEDDLFATFSKDQQDFWEYHRKSTFEGTIPQPLRELLAGMLEPHPEKRWTIEQIKLSKWYNRRPASPSKVLGEMKKRKQSVELVKERPDLRDSTLKYYTKRNCDKIQGLRKKGSKGICEKVGQFALDILSSFFPH
eukprot:TRINITY_DN6647_c0_g1_i1.p1 TRINITY_DN6647_c0_g1~~TRINITY_DN6647_c0_g1_i1.p1  ORF type:complete len:364 (+),score=47.46 TRINITY_DN6647_c0_g1_i1:1146-2237(+)